MGGVGRGVVEMGGELGERIVNRVFPIVINMPDEILWPRERKIYTCSNITRLPKDYLQI